MFSILVMVLDEGFVSFAKVGIITRGNVVRAALQIKHANEKKT